MCKIFRTKELEVRRIISRLNIQLQDYLEVCLEVKRRMEKGWRGFLFWEAWRDPVRVIPVFRFIILDDGPIAREVNRA
jgi:hypothetical protein